MKKTWDLALVLQIIQKLPENYCSSLYLSTGKVWLLNELWFKRYIQKCTLSHFHHDVTDLENQGMVENTKSWEQNITFLRNKKILNLCFTWQTLSSYRFVAQVNFKVKCIQKVSSFCLQIVSSKYNFSRIILTSGKDIYFSFFHCKWHLSIATV